MIACILDTTAVFYWIQPPSSAIHLLLDRYIFFNKQMIKMYLPDTCRCQIIQQLFNQFLLRKISLAERNQLVTEFTKKDTLTIGNALIHIYDEQNFEKSRKIYEKSFKIPLQGKIKKDPIDISDMNVIATALSIKEQIEQIRSFDDPHYLNLKRDEFNRYFDNTVKEEYAKLEMQKKGFDSELKSQCGFSLAHFFDEILKKISSEQLTKLFMDNLKQAIPEMVEEKFLNELDELYKGIHDSLYKQLDKQIRNLFDRVLIGRILNEIEPFEKELKALDTNNPEYNHDVLIVSSDSHLRNVAQALGITCFDPNPDKNSTSEILKKIINFTYLNYRSTDRYEEKNIRFEEMMKAEYEIAGKFYSNDDRGYNVINICSKGICIAHDEDGCPSCGENIRLTIKRHRRPLINSIGGEVCWQHKGKAGIRFHEKLQHDIMEQIVVTS
jgi:rRNA maturation endonuclease Nob1